MTARNILYAEDNPDDVAILEIACRRAKLPHVIRCVEDGERAIAWLRGDGQYGNRAEYPMPNILILDLKMPRKTGFDVLEWMRQAKGFERLPVMVLSSSDDPRDLKRASELGATRYFRKSAMCREVIEYLGSMA